jgi:excisionase family DNA binding protein
MNNQTASAGTSAPKLYSIKEVAALLQVNPRTVRRWIDAGDITTHRFGRQIRISDADLRAFIKQHRQS